MQYSVCRGHSLHRPKPILFSVLARGERSHDDRPFYDDVCAFHDDNVRE